MYGIVVQFFSRKYHAIFRKLITKHSQEIACILKAAGVGQRPIIWLTHSMGGLLVKCMLMNESQNFPPKENAAATVEDDLKKLKTTQANVTKFFYI